MKLKKIYHFKRGIRLHSVNGKELKSFISVEKESQPEGTTRPVTTQLRHSWLELQLI